MKKPFGRRAGAVDTKAPATDRAATGSPVADRHARGLRGSVDAPTGEIVTPGTVVVSGWVFHRARPVRQVVVTFDGELVAIAATGEPRPDVLAVHSSDPSSGTAGWTVEVDCSRHLHGSIEVQAYAVLDTGPEDEVRLRPLVRFGAQVVRSVRSDAELGAITPMAGVSPGFVEVSGTARHPAGLAAVEVSVAGGDQVLARHSLPGRVVADHEIDDDPDLDIAGFSAFVRVPAGMERVGIEVSVVGLDGTRATLRPIEVSVTPPPPELLFTPPAGEVVASRSAGQLELLDDPSSGPRRVLIATHDLGIGGAQLYLHLLIKKLRERGIDLCLVSGIGGALAAELEEELDVPVLIIGPTPSDRGQLESLILRISAFAATHRVVGGLANTLVAFPSVYALQQLGLPTTWAIHESFEPASFFRQYRGEQLPESVMNVVMAALEQCEEVVFEAEATRIVHAAGVPDMRSAVVPYGVDLALVEAYAASHHQKQVREQLLLPQSSRILVCVGMVEPRKGQLALVRAFGRLPAEVREDVVLVVVGMGGDPYSSALRDLVESTGLDGVRLVDVDPDVLRWYQAADVLVSASDVESVPRSMLEAMAMGRPVAATDAFGVGEIVTEGETGFTCAPLDLASLTDMLYRVLQTRPEELVRLGDAARDLVRRRHDPEGYADHYARRLSSWLSR